MNPRMIYGISALTLALGGTLYVTQRSDFAALFKPALLPPVKKIFVAGVLSGVHAIDVKTGKISPAIDTGILPHNLMLSADGKLLYVTNVGSQSVSVIDVATEKKVKDILVGEIPKIPQHAKVPPERMAKATSCFECHKVRAVGSLPNALAWDAEHKYMMVNELRRRAVTFLDPLAGKTVRTVSFDDLPTPTSPSNMVVSPTTHEIWVLHRFETPEYKQDGPLGAKSKGDFAHDPPAGQHVSWVTVHDRDMTRELARIKMTLAVAFDAAFSPDGRWLYVAYRSANQIAVFDTQSKTLARQIQTGVAPTGLALSPDGKKLYVTCSFSDPSVVQIIDVASGEIELSMGVRPTPSLIVTDEATGHIFVTVAGYNAVLEIDPVAKKLLREYPAGHQPLSLVLVR